MPRTKGTKEGLPIKVSGQRQAGAAREATPAGPGGKSSPQPEAQRGCRGFVGTLQRVQKFPSISSLLRVFTGHRYYILSDAFSTSIEMFRWFSFFSLLNEE